MADGSPPPSKRPRTRALFFGLTGSFSIPPLEALLAAGNEVCGVIVPGHGAAGWRPVPQGGPPARTGLPVLTPYVQRTAVQVAWEHGVPVYEVPDLGAAETVEAIRRLQPDVIAVACFDRLIPRQVRQLARLAVNVHPSLLPDNRGPMPLFWTFRLGLPETGVTVHLLEDAADAGAVVAQARVAVPEGVDGSDLDRSLVETGGRLLVETVRQLEAGALQPRAQDESRATAYGWPSAEDWIVPLDWPARRAYNFIRGVAHLGGPLQIAGRLIRAAVGYEQEGRVVQSTPPEGDLLRVQMNPGLLTVCCTA